MRDAVATGLVEEALVCRGIGFQPVIPNTDRLEAYPTRYRQIESLFHGSGCNDSSSLPAPAVVTIAAGWRKLEDRSLAACLYTTQEQI